MTCVKVAHAAFIVPKLYNVLVDIFHCFEWFYDKIHVEFSHMFQNENRLVKSLFGYIYNSNLVPRLKGIKLNK